jgi:hypothetical protein
MIERIVDKITRFPILFGALIGLVILTSIMVIVNWFPRVGEAWERNNATVRSVYFTAGFFTIWISRVWRWRRRNTLVFWVSVCAFLLLHALGVFLYSIRVHPLLMKEWIYLMVLESFALIFGLDWLTKRFRHLPSYGHNGLRADHPTGSNT